MKDFTDDSYAAFQEAAIEKYDFSTCQRADGSYYGTGGTCRIGSPVNGVPEKEKKGKASGGGGSGGGEYRTRPKGAIESDMKKLTSSGAMNQKGTAGVKAREEHAKLKAELKKPLKGANSKSGGGGVSDAQAAALSKDLTRQIGEAAKKGDKKAVDNLMLAKSTVDGQIKARAAASGKGGAAEQLRQINAQEGRGGGVGKSGRSSVGKKGVISSKEKAAMSKNVRSLDKKAKEADKKAEAADKKWRKGGMKDKALQKEVRSLDRQAKAANKEAEKADKAFQRAIKK